MKALKTIVISILCVVGFPVRAEYQMQLQGTLSGNQRLTAVVDGEEVNFTFDTGCSSLTINQVLFDELVRKGVVKRSDLSETCEAEMANGEMHDVRYFTIKSLKMGDYVWHNVRASVGVHDRPDADPLLGQAILSRCEYFAISNGVLVFEPKPDDVQQAIYYCDMHHTDTTFAGNQKLEEKMRPYLASFSPRYLIFYAQALEYINQERQAIPIYEQLLQSDTYYDEEGKVFRQKVNAKVNYADQLYNAEAYDECEKVLHDILREAPLTQPVYEHGMEYAHSTLCYLYWQTKEYDKAEQATMQYADYLLAPKTWQYLETHVITPNKDLARLLHHLSQWHAYKENEQKAALYDKMAKHAGYKE